MKTKKMTSSYIASPHNKFFNGFCTYKKNYLQRNTNKGIHCTQLKTMQKSYIDSIFDKTQGLIKHCFSRGCLSAIVQLSDIMFHHFFPYIKDRSKLVIFKISILL